MIVLVIGDGKFHAGIVLRLPVTGERIDDLPVGGIASALAVDRGGRYAVPFTDTSGRVVAVETRRRVERHFDQAFARIPDTVAGVLPDGFVVGDQAVLARLHDTAGDLLGLGPLRLVPHGITGPRAVNLGQQTQRGALRETIGVARALGVVNGPGKHLGGVFQVLFDIGVDILRGGLLVIFVLLARIGRRSHQHDIAVPAHQFEIEQRTQSPGLAQIDGGQFAVRRAPAVHAVRNSLDEVVGIVNRRIELLPRAGDLRRRGIVGVGRNLAERSRRTPLALGDVGRDREQQRQVVRIGVLVRQILVNALKNRFRLFGVVQVVALAGLRVGFLVEQVGARGEQQAERQAV